MRVVIVGGVAAGMSAATRLRRLDERAEIVVLEAGDHVSFANCGLPYHVGGVIEDRSALLRDPAALATRSRLDIRLGHEAVAIDREARTVQVRASDGTLSLEPYDALLLAGGAASAQHLPSDGSTPVHTLRTVADMDAIVAVLEGGARTAVVVGGGYIGLEAVENLVRRGLATTLVVRGDRVLALDPEMAAPVHRRLAEHGVTLRFGRAAQEVAGGAVVLDDGERLPADLVVEAIGIAPDTAVAREAGLEVGDAGGIVVDARHRTSDPAIWAAGDAALKTDAVDGAATVVALAGLANRHGRAAADAIAGTAEDAAPALGTAIVGIFGLAVGTLGWTEGRLIAEGRPHRVLHTHPADHATYYPGASELVIKLLVDAATDRVLGAQVVGEHGVDKRIDVIATAIAGGLTASALSRLELAYAPQFGSAKDAVNLLGYVAENLANGTVRAVQWHELARLQDEGWTLVDVRTPEEFAAGAIPGAVHVPLDELRERHGEIPAERVVVHCRAGQRSFTAARILSGLGHDVVNLDGGYRTWEDGVAAVHDVEGRTRSEDGYHSVSN